MCCHGCQAVAQAIVDGGLGDYYRHRTATSITAQNLVPEELTSLNIYDQPEVQRSFVSNEPRDAAEVKQAAHMNLLAGFPEDSDDSDETDAKPDIWMDWEDFQAKFKDLQQAADQLAITAAKGDKEATSKQFGETGKTCKACHKAYKN